MFSLIITLMFSSLIYGDYSGGHPGSNFLYGSNARDVALSGSTVSTYNRGYNAFINPALLSKTKNNEYGFSHFIMSLDRSIQSISISRQLPPAAGVSLSFFRSGTDNVYGTDSFGNPTSVLSNSEGYGMISFGINFIENLSAGFNIKTYFNNLDEYSANGIGFDLGLLYKKKYINMAFKINNLSSGYSWKIDSNYEEKIPVNYALGFSYNKFKNLLLLSQINIIQIPDIIPIFNKEYKKFYNRLHLGIEYRLDYNQNKSIALRSGVKELNNKLSYSLGFGMPFKIGKNRNLFLDYALDLGVMSEGIGHLFTFTMENK